MPLRRTFRRSLRARALRDPAFRVSMLRDGVEAIASGDLTQGRARLRDYVNAATGFARLARETGIPEKSLMRMLGPEGNPRARHLAAILSALLDHEGVVATVRLAEPD